MQKDAGPAAEGMYKEPTFVRFIKESISPMPPYPSSPMAMDMYTDNGYTVPLPSYILEIFKILEFAPWGYIILWKNALECCFSL